MTKRQIYEVNASLIYHHIEQFILCFLLYGLRALLPSAGMFNQSEITLPTPTIYLSNGNSQDEQGRGTVGIAVEVPLAIDFAGQRLIGNMSDQPLGEPQADLISETAAF